MKMFYLFILRHIGIRNERTDFEEFFLAEKRKRDRACENSSDKRQSLNFFLNVSKKSFCLNKDFIPSRIFESFKKKA